MEKDIGSVQRQLAQPVSALAKYKETMVGNRGLLLMFYVELAVFFLGSISGNVGRAVRRIALKPVFRHIGKKVCIGREFFFRRPHRIEIHAGACLGDRITLNVKSADGEIVLGADTQVGSNVIFSCPGGRLEVGEKTSIGRYSRLGSLMGLSVGKHCRIGESSYIVGAGHAISSLDVPIINQPINCKGPNVIGDHVVIGDRVTILDGVSIGAHAVIDSDSLVIHNVPANERVCGAPARPVQEGHTA